MDPLHDLLQRLVVATHQAARDFQVLLLGFFPGLEHAADARRVDREGLFHEHVAALRDRVFQMDRPESRRRGQNDEAPRGDQVNGLLVSVKAEELPIRGHVDVLAELVREILQAGRHAVAEHVGHGHQLLRTLRGQGVDGGPRSAAAAAHQRDLDGVVFPRVDARCRSPSQTRRRPQPRSTASETHAALPNSIRCFVESSSRGPF